MHLAKINIETCHLMKNYRFFALKYFIECLANLSERLMWVFLIKICPVWLLSAYVHGSGVMQHVSFLLQPMSTFICKESNIISLRQNQKIRFSPWKKINIIKFFNIITEMWQHERSFKVLYLFYAIQSMTLQISKNFIKKNVYVYF